MGGSIERRRGVRSASAALTTLLVAGPATAQGVANIVAGAEGAGIRTAICVLDASDDSPVYRRGASAARLPASNQKIVTAWAVLDALGADFRFRTGVRVTDGVVMLEAGGDPNWITGGPLDPSATFAEIAASLRAEGITSVRGVALDRGAFTGPTRPDGWPRDQLAFDYCAPTGAVALDQGCWIVELAPSGDHDALVRVVSPPRALGLSGRLVMTDDVKEGGRYHMAIRDGRLELRGHYWTRGDRRSVRGAIDDPEARFVTSLERALERAGIDVDRRAEPRTAALAAIESPLGPALERCLRHSSNFDAEQLLRVLGAEVAGDGSFAGGTAAVRDRLVAAFGPLPDAVQVADGSGLSRDNRITPELLARVLTRAARGPAATAFVAALPVPGDEGTLENRFRDREVGARVRAKTGTLSGVSALSGYLRTRSGRLLAFSILMEWPRRVQGDHPRVWQERIVAALDRS